MFFTRVVGEKSHFFAIQKGGGGGVGEGGSKLLFRTKRERAREVIKLTFLVQESGAEVERTFLTANDPHRNLWCHLLHVPSGFC